MMMHASFCAGSHDGLHIGGDIFRAGIGEQRSNFRCMRSACRPVASLCNTQQPYSAECLHDGSPWTFCSLRRRLRWKAIDLPKERYPWQFAEGFRNEDVASPFHLPLADRNAAGRPSTRVNLTVCHIED